MNRILLQKPIRPFTKKKFWTTTMAMLLFFMVLGTLKVQAQIVMTVSTPLGNTTPALAASYPSLGAALTALNGVTAVTGNVQITAQSGGTETAPAKGFTIGSTSLNATMSGSVYFIYIDGLNTTINAGVGTSSSAVNPDGMIKLVGADHITLNRFTLVDGNTSGVAMMEFGIGLFKLTATDGCNNNEISNNNISIQRANTFAAAGIIPGGATSIIMANSIHANASAPLTPTSVSGANSFNTFYNNYSVGGLNGIVLSGYSGGASPYTFADYSNLVNSNSIYRFGTNGAISNIAQGINTSNQFEVRIDYNSIDNSYGTGINHIYNLIGIVANGTTATNPIISNNIVQLRSGSTNSQISGIVNVSGTSSTVNINTNTIRFGYPNGVNPAVVGVRGIQNASIPTTLNINDNIIEGIAGVPIAGTSETNFIINNTTTATATVNTNGNIIRNFERTGASGTMYGIRIIANNWTANGNTIDNLKWSNINATGEIFAIQNFGASTTNIYSNNIISNLTTATTGAIVGIRDVSAGAKTANGNTISNFTKVAGTADGGTHVGILLGGTTNSIFGNKIFGFTGNFNNVCGILATSSGAGNTGIRENKIYDLSSSAVNAIEVVGIKQDGDATAAIWNNVISGLTAPNVNSTAFTVNGINISVNTPAMVYYNTVLLSGTSSGTDFSSSVINSGALANLVLRNNIFINNMTPKGAGRAAAYFRNGTDLTSYDASSNNNLLAGTSIFYDSTNNDATLAAFKTRMATRDQASVTETTTPFTSTVGSSVDFLRLPTNAVSVANDNAVTVTSPAITADYFGVVRSTTTPDIGASEFTGLVCTAPTVYAVSGGGNGCGSTGVPVGLVNSQTGVNYQLKLNGTATGGLVAGTGAALAFGNQTVAGTYTVDATSNITGCTTVVAMSGSAVVTISPAVTATTSQTNVSCFGGSTGSASVLAAGGTAPFTYSWSPSGGTSATTTGRTAANYICTITDAVGCSTTTNITITQPPALSTVASFQTNIACNGASTGAAGVNPSGGTVPYTYSWTNGATTNAISGVVAGNYTVTVTDGNSCTATRSFTITQPPALSNSSVVTNIACNGLSTGSINITVTGGTAPYTYNWGGGIVTEDRTGLPAGSYSVIITDAISCTLTRNFTITQPLVLAVTPVSQSNVACFGGFDGAASVSVSGGTPGYSYNWTPGTPTGDGTASVTNLVAGTWTCTVTDLNACTTSSSFTVTQPASAISGTTVVTNVSCNGGTNGAINLTPAGGVGPYTFNWGGGITTKDRTGLAAGTYTVTITDINGCIKTVNANIIQPTAVSGTTVVINLACNGGANGAINLTPSGGAAPYTFNWGGGITTEDRTGLAAGTYSVTITGANGCTGTLSAITVTEPTAVSGTTVVTNVSCFGGSNGTASVTASGGTGSFTYSWSPSGGNAATASGLTAGNYTCTITDANGCTATSNFIITQPPAIATTQSQTNVSCFGGSNGTASVTASGGTGSFAYSWSPSGGTNATASGLTAGNYTCTITDANGCTATSNFTITQPTAITGTQSQTNVSCFGGSNGTASVNASGGTGTFTYSWSPSGGTNATASGLTAGNYTCTITDANGCTATRTFSISQSAPINLTAASQTNVSCNGGSNGAASVNNVFRGYSYTYNWSPGTPVGDGTTSVTGLTAGVWSCTVTESTGCTQTLNFTITEPAAIVATQSQTNVSCFGGTNGLAGVTASGGISPYTYSWSNGPVTSSVTGLAAGSYICRITDNNGCMQAFNFTITQPAAVDNSVSQASGVLSAVQNGATYQWFVCPNAIISGANNQNFTPTATGDYKVEVTLSGCTVTSSCITVTNLGTDTFDFNSKISVYPNPSRDVFSVNSDTRGSIVIFDLIGKTIKSENMDLGITKLDLSKYPSGIYLMKVTNDKNQTKNIKLIKH